MVRMGLGWAALVVTWVFVVECLWESGLESLGLVAPGWREALVLPIVDGVVGVGWGVVTWEFRFFEVVSVCCGDELLLFMSTLARRNSEGTKEEMSAPS